MSSVCEYCTGFYSTQDSHCFSFPILEFAITLFLDFLKIFIQAGSFSFPILEHAITLSD